MGKRKHRRNLAIRRARTEAVRIPVEEELAKAPHTFVVKRGEVGHAYEQLVHDFRSVMEPYTASKLKVLKSNKLKDFLAAAGPLNVTHLISFSKSKTACYAKFCRLPHGPSLTFHVKEYSLKKDVVSAIKKPYIFPNMYRFQPFLVMNNFTGDGMHIKLMVTMFQNMFPSINVNKIKLNQIKRCVLLNYNPETELIDVRHYVIRIVPHDLSRSAKKLIRNKVPDLSQFAELSEFMIRSYCLSDSEAELDGPHSEVTMPQKSGHFKGNAPKQKSAIRLVELGPRMTLQLNKIQEGFLDGKELYSCVMKKDNDDTEPSAKKAKLT